MAEDYDVLSDLGRAQAGRLGERWARLGLRFDAVYAGPRRRQRHTAEIVGETMGAAGLPWPQARVLEELDEYQAEPMLKRFVPELAERDREVKRLFDAFVEAGDDRAEHARRFERLFQAVMRRWAEGAFRAPDVESWDAFEGRVQRGLEILTAPQGRSRRVAAFTSGGAIGTAVGTVLGTDAETKLELGWALHNCGVCEIRFSSGRRSLSRYNDLAHLPEPDDWTYR